MGRRARMTEQQVVGTDGKIVTVSVPVARDSVLTPPVIPSAIVGGSAADDELTAEVADTLGSGVGVHAGDFLTVTFTVADRGPAVPSDSELLASVTDEIGGQLTPGDRTLVWDTVIDHDGAEINLHEIAVLMTTHLRLGEATEQLLSFHVDRYTSPVEARVESLTAEEQKALALAPDATAEELIALLHVAAPNVQISALGNPATPDDIIHEVANHGPYRVEVDRNEVATRSNKTVQHAASSELSRRARLARRRS